MATVASMAIRDQLARERIDAATATLAERHGIDVPTVPFIRDPHLARIAQLESHAAIFEALVEAADTKPKKRAPTKPKKGAPVSDLEKVDKDAAKDGVALGVEETKAGDPVVVTESVDGEVPAFGDQPDDTADGRKATTKKGKS